MEAIIADAILSLERGSTMGAGRIARADLSATCGTGQGQFRATGRTVGIVLTKRGTASRAQGLPAGLAFRRTGRETSATSRTDNTELEPTTRAGRFLGKQQEVALRAEARAALRAWPLRRHKMGLTYGTDRPTHEGGPHLSRHAAGGDALLVSHRLPTVGAAVGGAEEGLTAVGAAAGKDQPTIGTDLGTGEEFHAAPWAGIGQFQTTLGTTLRLLIHGGAAARAEKLPTGGAGRVATIDAGTAPGTGDLVAGSLRLRLRAGFLGHRAAVEDEATMGAVRIVWTDFAVATGARQGPRFATHGAGHVVWADEGTAGRAQVGVTVGAHVRVRFKRSAAAGTIRHGRFPP
jgi:hypothetical protein